jgi:hypothetical protein
MPAATSLYAHRRRAAVLLAALCLAWGCGADDRVARRSLEAVAKAELTSFVNELPPANQPTAPYFEIVAFEPGKKGRFSVKAVVDYYYLKNVTVKLTRKYRFVRWGQRWEPYNEEWRFFQDSSKVVH